MAIRALCAAAAVALTLVVSVSAAGQTTDDRLRFGGFVGLTQGNGGTGQSGGLTFAYRLAPRLMIEGDATYVAGLDFGAFPACPPGLQCFRGGSFSLHRRGVLLTANMLVHLPAAGRWLRPYVAAGGGYARFSIEREDLLRPDWPWAPVTTQAPVFVIGGGLLFPLRQRLVVRTDARYQLALRERPGFGFRDDIPDHFQWVRLGCAIEARF